MATINLSLVEIAVECRHAIEAADAAGVALDDGNVVDLCADNVPATLADIRAALVVAGYAARFPQATYR